MMKSFLICLFALLSSLIASGAELRILTWNLEWFPSRNSSKRESPEKEAQTIQKTAKILKSLEPNIIVLQEIRDFKTAKQLAKQLGENYSVTVCSNFLQGSLPGWQQMAILSNLPAEGGWSERWGSLAKVDPARGFVFSEFLHNGKRIAIYGLHLKSNMNRKGDFATNQLNLLKRELAILQLLEHLKKLEIQTGKFDEVFIAGDMNTNLDESQFASEGTLRWLQKAGFSTGYENTPAIKRQSWRGNSRLPGCTLDFIFSRNSKSSAHVLDLPGSDHRPVLKKIDL